MPITNRFRPPRYRLCRLPADDAAGWAAIPPIALLTDLHAEEVPLRDVTIRLAWSEDRLHLSARGTEAGQMTLDESRSPDDPTFWEQDHIEFQLWTNPACPADRFHVIMPLHGVVFDNRGLWRNGDIRSSGAVADGAWSAQWSVGWSDLDLPAPEAGSRIRAQVAHVRWGDGRMDVAALSATELGFGQVDRYAELVLDGPPPDVQLTHLAFDRQRRTQGANACWATLVNRSGRPLVTRVLLRQEPDDATAGRTLTREVELQPGESELPFELPLQRPQYSLFSFHFVDQDGLTRECGAFSLRAAPRWVEPAELNLRHPMLMLRDDVLAEIRAKKDKPAFSRMRRHVDIPPPDALDPLDAEAFSKLSRPQQNVFLVRVLCADLNGWVLEGDRAYIEHATRTVRLALERMREDGGTNGLDDSKTTVQLPIVYDTFWPHLREPDREAWRQLCERYLLRYLATARRPHWDVSAVPNANPCCNAGGAMLALVLHDHPHAAEALYLARKYIGHHLDYCIGADGVNTEWMQYAEFAWSTTLKYAHALELTLGCDEGVYAHPGILKAGAMFRLSLSNTGRCFGFNDSYPAPVGAAVAWHLGSRYGDDFLLWYGDHALRYAERVAGENPPSGYRHVHIDALAYAYRPDIPEQAVQPALPLVQHSRDTEIAVVRSGAEYDCALVAAFKGSRPPYTHHNQADTGSYVIDLRGEDIIIDTGYYRPDAADHSVPLIDGVGPPVPREWECTGRIVRAESVGPLRYLACDSTAAYRGRAVRVVRHLVMVGAEAVILLDDVVPEDSSAGVTAQYQAGGHCREMLPGRVLAVRRRRAQMRLELLTRPDLRLTVHPERFYDRHWGWYHTDCHWRPVSGVYPSAPDDPLVTAFVDVSEEDRPQCQLEKTRAGLLVVLPSGREVRFDQDRNGWSLVTGEGHVWR